MKGRKGHVKSSLVKIVLGYLYHSINKKYCCKTQPYYFHNSLSFLFDLELGYDLAALALIISIHAAGLADCVPGALAAETTEHKYCGCDSDQGGDGHFIIPNVTSEPVCRIVQRQISLAPGLHILPNPLSTTVP